MLGLESRRAFHLIEPAVAFDHEDDLLPHVPMLAGALAGVEELHIGLDAAFPRVQAMMNKVLDQAVGTTLPRHVLSFDDVRPRFVLFAEILRGGGVIGVKSAIGGARTSRAFVLESHCLALLKCRRGGCRDSGPAAIFPGAISR